MAIVSDNAIDGEIRTMKLLLDELRRCQTAFSNTFTTMPPKERATMIHKIQSDHKTIKAFLEKNKRLETQNSGTRFALENLKQTFQSLLTVWRKTEKNLENFTQGSAPKTSYQGGPNQGETNSETQQAVDKYTAALRNLGHVANTEMINEFKSKLAVAYDKAKEKSGGRDLEIKIVQEGSKIKVRMEPKG